MRFSRFAAECTAVIVILGVLGLCLPTSPANAGWIGTRPTVDSAKARFTALLERQDVSAVLAQVGVDPLEAKRRAAGMTEAEARQAMERIDSLPAGGDALGTIIFAAVLIFLVLLVTDILGYTDIFPFVVTSSA